MSWATRGLTNANQNAIQRGGPCPGRLSSPDSDQKFEVWVATDAYNARTERNRDAAFDRLAGAGAELVTTEMVAFEWLRTAEHPAFKDMLALVK